MASILEALMPICNVGKLSLAAGYTVVELVFGDGRVYGQRSLTGKVGGRLTTYHHSEESHLDWTRNSEREMLFDPSQSLSQIDLNSLPQVDSDYLADCDTLGPGMRVCAVEDVPGADRTAIQEHLPCTSEVVVRNETEIRMTVSNKAFDNYNSISHL